jgi:hypothetical protein
MSCRSQRHLSESYSTVLQVLTGRLKTNENLRENSPDLLRRRMAIGPGEIE